jgi:hypothetical protein
MTIALNAASESDLRPDIFRISNDFVQNGITADDYVINITGDFTLTQSLPMIRGGDLHAITIDGNGETINANNAGRVFFVESGNVTINDITIANAFAQGGNGGVTTLAQFGGAGDGGLGAGAALFVNTGATVTLTDVHISDAVRVARTRGGKSYLPPALKRSEAALHHLAATLRRLLGPAGPVGHYRSPPYLPGKPARPRPRWTMLAARLLLLKTG